MVSCESIIAEKAVEVYGVLVAREIHLNTVVKGSGVFMGMEKVSLPHETDLTAPCQIALLENVSTKRRPAEIHIQGGHIQGTIFTLAREKNWNTPVIRIDEDTTVSGYIYTTGHLRLEGKLTGHAATGNLLARSGAMNFKNWMKNLQIDRSEERINWALPLGWGEKTEVLVWIKR